MWNTEPVSSGGREPLSEYEHQRLENIKQMSVQFNDLFEEVSNSAHNLAKATSKSAATNSSNGKRRSQNPQQYHQVKLFSKGQKRSHSHPTRRSRRLIDEKKKKPEYNEGNDSDDETPSKLLRLKFPFFKKNEYAQRDEDYYKELDDDDFIDSDNELMEYDDSFSHSKRRHQVSMNTHQIPVSLITQEMLNNITYSSCGKTYAVNGTTCHQCRQKTLDQKSYCRYKKCRGIRGMFCGFCLGKRYGENVAEVLLNKKWACPPCRGYCNCSICRRKRGRSPTGQLSQIAQAGGYKSVKHMLETTEGGAPEKDLSSDYDSDENDLKGDQENGISESINNNSNDNGISQKKTKTEKINEQDIKTEQNDGIVTTKNENETDCVNSDAEDNGNNIPEDNGNNNDEDNGNNILEANGNNNDEDNGNNPEDNGNNNAEDNVNNNIEGNTEEVVTCETIIDMLYQKLFGSQVE